MNGFNSDLNAKRTESPFYGSFVARNVREDPVIGNRLSDEFGNTAVPVRDLGIVSRRQPPQQHASAVVIVLIFLFSYTVSSFNSNGNWEYWPTADCFKMGLCACEHSQSQLVRQTANAWSSLSFVICGAYIVGFGSVPVGAALAAQNHAVDFYESFETFMVTLGVSLILLGWSSWLFHSSLSLIGQISQSFSLFLVASSIAFYCLTAGDYMRSGKQYWWAWLGVSAILGLLDILFPAADPYLCAAMWPFMLIALLLMKRRRKSKMSIWIVLSAALLQILGFVSWLLDYLHVPVFCSPKSVFQGHALWHFLFAVSMLLAFFYLRSEEVDESEVEEYWTPAQLQNAEL